MQTPAVIHVFHFKMKLIQISAHVPADLTDSRLMILHLVLQTKAII